MKDVGNDQLRRKIDTGQKQLQFLSPRRRKILQFLSLPPFPPPPPPPPPPFLLSPFPCFNHWQFMLPILGVLFMAVCPASATHEVLWAIPSSILSCGKKSGDTLMPHKLEQALYLIIASSPWKLEGQVQISKIDVLSVC